MRSNIIFAALLSGSIAMQAAATEPEATVVSRLSAPEANQGVASDGTYAYAIDNSTIARYRIADGKRVAIWQGDDALFPHINSCTLAQRELVCAVSNYPQVPQLSSIAFFDPVTLTHKRSISLGMGPGSLTAVDRHNGSWWAIFANYDGKGGEPTRNHRYTLFARLDDNFQIERGWAFPDAILRCLSPRSVSGASWGMDGKLYVSGHDRPQIYVLSLPKAGGVLHLDGWFSISTHGQAIDMSHEGQNLIWSINRPTKEVFASKTPNTLNRDNPVCVD